MALTPTQQLLVNLIKPTGLSILATDFVCLVCGAKVNNTDDDALKHANWHQALTDTATRLVKVFGV